MKKAAIIFDHDGTLVYSIDAVDICTNIALTKYGFDEISKEDVIRGFTYPTAERFLYHMNNDDKQTAQKMSIEFYLQMQGVGIEHLKIYPGIQQALDRLARYGFSMGMVSNNQGLFVRKAAAHLHYAYDLEIILGEENVKALKPAPDGILQACAGLAALPENSWYIGDTISDRRAAQAAGLKSGAVTWGVESENQLQKCEPDRIFKTPAELTDFFINLETNNKAN